MSEIKDMPVVKPKIICMKHSNLIFLSLNSFDHNIESMYTNIHCHSLHIIRTWIILQDIKIKSSKPNVVVEWLTCLLSILAGPGSNLGPETGYHAYFVVFLSPSWHFTCFPIYHLLICPFGVLYSEPPKAPLNKL
jgi:hypothetical protein